MLLPNTESIVTIQEAIDDLTQASREATTSNTVNAIDTAIRTLIDVKKYYESITSLDIKISEYLDKTLERGSGKEPDNGIK